LSSRAARPSETDGEAIASAVTLGPRDRLVGQLYIEGNLRVGGTVEGQVEATGDVNVAEGATVKASVTGREVGISGLVQGPVTASKKLIVSRTGSLVGDVRVPRLEIQDGASFSGNVQMGKAAQAAAAEAAAPAPVPAEPVVVPESAVIAEAQPEKAKAKKR
jgi:cytoskeletal protein CcmA (bactofilin family)